MFSIDHLRALAREAEAHLGADVHKFVDFIERKFAPPEMTVGEREALAAQAASGDLPASEPQPHPAPAAAPAPDAAAAPAQPAPELPAAEAGPQAAPEAPAAAAEPAPQPTAAPETAA